jgi:hypothetical protein
MIAASFKFAFDHGSFSRSECRQIRAIVESTEFLVRPMRHRPRVISLLKSNGRRLVPFSMTGTPQVFDAVVGSHPGRVARCASRFRPLVFRCNRAGSIFPLRNPSFMPRTAESSSPAISAAVDV